MRTPRRTCTDLEIHALAIVDFIRPGLEA